MHGWLHTRCTTLQRRIMTILNAGLPQSNKIMYDFRKRLGGPSGELWFITDRDITSTLGRGDKIAMLAVSAQSPALQSKAIVMNWRPSECGVPTCPLCKLQVSEHERCYKWASYFHKKTKECSELVWSCKHAGTYANERGVWLSDALLQ